MKVKICVTKDSRKHPDNPYRGSMRVFRTITPGVGWWEEDRSVWWFATEEEAISGMKTLAEMAAKRLKQEFEERDWKYEEVIEL